MLNIRKVYAAAVIRWFSGVQGRKSTKSLGVLHQMRCPENHKSQENKGPEAWKYGSVCILQIPTLKNISQ